MALRPRLSTGLPLSEVLFGCPEGLHVQALTQYIGRRCRTCCVRWPVFRDLPLQRRGRLDDTLSVNSEYADDERVIRLSRRLGLAAHAAVAARLPLAAEALIAAVAASVAAFIVVVQPEGVV